VHQLPFIVGAYAVGAIVLGGLTLSSYLRMRRAEREEE
jgi:heme exporter protein CcmD